MNIRVFYIDFHMYDMYSFDKFACMDKYAYNVCFSVTKTFITLCVIHIVRESQAIFKHSAKYKINNKQTLLILIITCRKNTTVDNIDFYKDLQI